MFAPSLPYLDNLPPFDLFSRLPLALAIFSLLAAFAATSHATSIGRVVIWTAEFAALFGLALATLSAGRVGFEIGLLFQASVKPEDLPQHAGPGFVKLLPLIFGALGGAIGFIVAALLSSFLFLLLAIERNTRRP
jgi:hypothetical protein